VITFLPSLASRLSVDHYPKVPCLPVFLTGYKVFHTFASVSFSVTLSDWYRTGPAVFSRLTGIRFVFSVAGDFSASSCPINRAGKSAYFLQHSLPSVSCDPKFRSCLSGFDLMFRIFHTSCRISAVVANSFRTVPLSDSIGPVRQFFTFIPESALSSPLLVISPFLPAPYPD
jgi:hypothetical protein